MTQVEFFLIDPLDSLTQIGIEKISHWGLKMMLLHTHTQNFKTYISKKQKKCILKDEDTMT